MPLPMDETPVFYRDLTALEAPPVDRSVDDLIVDVRRAGDALGQGTALTPDQLDEFRDATRRLRRAIEMRAIASPVLCDACRASLLVERRDAPDRCPRCGAALHHGVPVA
jgi:predicted Zn-ribbon and HTH transcriptional regulator